MGSASPLLVPLSLYRGKQIHETLGRTNLLAHCTPGITATREGHGHKRSSSSNPEPFRQHGWWHFLTLHRWRLAVLRTTAWPKVVPEPLHEPGGCWKLEFILDAEYSQGLRANFNPCIHTCSTVRAVSQESVPDHLISPSTVSSGDKKHLKINQNSRQLAILY